MNLEKIIYSVFFFVLLALEIVLIMNHDYVAVFYHTLFVAISVYFLFVQKNRNDLYGYIYLVVVLLNGFGWAFRLYHDTEYFDELMHLVTPFAMTLVFANTIYDKVASRQFGEIFATIVAFTTIGIALGVAWEIGEWVLAKNTPVNLIPNIDDTFIDLIMDTAGSFFAASFHIFISKKRT